MKEKEIKNGDGITLIALVITIIVLLILAAVSIATLTGQNGILTQAGNAKEETRGANVKEQVELWKVNKFSNNIIGESSDNMNESELLDDLELRQDLITHEERVKLENERVIVIGTNVISLNEESSEEYIEIYAKLYSYNDGRGDFLEFSSNPEYKNTSSECVLKNDYGNIGNVSYHMEFKETYIYDEENDCEIMSYEERGTVPPWLNKIEDIDEGEGYKATWTYYENENIVEVKIVDEIKPFSMASWFCDCYNLKDIDLSKINTARVVDMSNMFEGCEKLTSLNVSEFDTSKVTNMSNMFFRMRSS